MYQPLPHKPEEDAGILHCPIQKYDPFQLSKAENPYRPPHLNKVSMLRHKSGVLVYIPSDAYYEYQLYLNYCFTILSPIWVHPFEGRKTHQRMFSWLS